MMRSLIHTILLLLVLFAFPLSAAPRLTVTHYGLVDTDVPYASLHRNSMDLYIPHQLDFSGVVPEEDPPTLSIEPTARRVPVVLFIHGGSFVAGDRKEFPYAQIGESFQRRGILCAVMSYRLMHDSVWPAQPRDVARAFRWLKENVAAYGGDPERIFIVGHSAGGHLAALVSTDSSYLKETGLSLSDIAGTVAMGAMMSDAGSLAALTPVEEQRLFSTDWFFRIFGSRRNFLLSLPIAHVNAEMPPMLLMLADSERFNPPKEHTILEFRRLAEQVSAPVRYTILKDRSHMGIVEHMADPSDPAFDHILSFISSR